MPKRFTDTDKWRDEWFLELSKENKLIWLYLCDNCTIGGRWKKSLKHLNFCCDSSISENKLKDIFNGRIIDFDAFLFIPKFLKFQYPQGLNSNKPAIIAIRKELSEYNLSHIVSELFGNGYLTIKDKDKDKDQDKDKDKDKEPVINNTILLEERRSLVLSDPDIDICKGFMEYLREYHANRLNSILRGKEDWQIYEQWLNDIRILSNKGYGEDKILKAIKFAIDDNFWREQFYSISKLNKKNKNGVLYIDEFLHLSKEKISDKEQMMEWLNDE